jgi:DNA polymerase III delta prime subunit
MATKKPTPKQDVEQVQGALHLKYRPKTLDKIIGHSDVVTRLKGILTKGKFPSALAFFGPPSAGKTTFARAFAFAVNGQLNMDFKEVNAADERGIDDVRELIKMSKFRPQSKKRIIFIDEAHQLISNNPAAQTLLKSLEEPAKDTIWIIGSMEPSKFSSVVGKAILSRCTQFVLQQHTESDLFKQAVRIAKGEDMSYLLDEKKLALKHLAKNCNGEMRTLANLMQSTQQYYDGMEDQPEVLSKKDLASIISSTESSEDKLAVQMMTGLYQLQFKKVQRALLEVTDPFSFIKKCGFISSFILNEEVVEGRHPKVWWTQSNREVHAAIKDAGVTLGMKAAVNATIVKTQSQAMSFQVPATDLLSADLYFLIKAQAEMMATKKKDA